MSVNTSSAYRQNMPFTNKFTKAKKTGSKSCIGQYRVSFNGKEQDNVTYGNGNEYDYGF